METQFTRDKQKEWARELYTREDLSPGDIALKVGAAEADIRLWATQGNWSGLKRSLLTSRSFQMDNLYRLLENLTEKMKEQEEVNPRDADLLVKYTAAIRNLDAETDIPSIVQVARLFTTWLRRRDHDLAQSVTVQFDAFISQRISPAAE